MTNLNQATNHQATNANAANAANAAETEQEKDRYWLVMQSFAKDDEDPLNVNTNSQAYQNAYQAFKEADDRLAALQEEE